MSTEPVATIVIPTFNRADMVTRAIDTAIGQSVPCEVIVSDHGSTDATPEVVSKYGDRVVYLRREKDNGPFFSWLDGIINAGTEYVHLTYDDDWLDPTFMEKCLGVFKEDCAFALSVTQMHFEDGRLGRKILDSAFETGIHPAEGIEAELLKHDLTISPGCGVFRKDDALQAIQLGAIPLATGSYRGAGPDLLMLLMPLLKYPSFGFVNEPLAHFLAHSASITTDAHNQLSKKMALANTYADAKKYYLILKEGQEGNRGAALYRPWRARKWLAKVERLYARTLKPILKREK